MRIEVLKQIAELDKTDLVEFGEKFNEILENEQIKVSDRGALTPRQREVLQLASQGKSNGEIAQLLLINKRTVEIHRANGMKKLHLKSKMEQLMEYTKDI